MQNIIKTTTTTSKYLELLYKSQYKPALLQRILNSFIANGHTGTKKQKYRVEVSGKNSKPWVQKGTGRARAGFITNCIFRKGGLPFPNRGAHRPIHKINKNMYAGQVQCIFSKLYAENMLEFVVSDEVLSLESPQTKHFKEMITNSYPNSMRVLFLLGNPCANLILGYRNIHQVVVANTKQNLDLTVLIKSDIVIASEYALMNIKRCLPSLTEKHTTIAPTEQ